MKKCALFLLICCFALASCNKNSELTSPVSNYDREIESNIEKGFNALHTYVVDHFGQLQKKELVAVKKQLEAGATLSEVHPQFTTNYFQTLQVQLAENFKRLSYYKDQDKLDSFIENLTHQKFSTKRHLEKSTGTPCFDAWDAEMATIAATVADCLTYSSPDLWSLSKCGAIAAIGIAGAELTYQNCMAQYE